MSEPASIAIDGERDATRPLPGEIVGGRYRLLRLLGEGGMGLVFEAEHVRLRQRVAIKFLRPEVAMLPEAVERFEREARASACIRGANVVHVADVDTDARGRPYIVMELLRGRDLQAELQARGPLPIAVAVDWVLQACAAASQAHAAGIVHRDLKPANLFLAEEAGTRIVKVLDFGISKIAVEEAAVTATAVTIGTPLYMSPEQVRSSKDVDARTDIWSLGVILFELLAGGPPFLGTTTAAIAAIVADATPSLRVMRPDVPERLERVIVTALAKDARDRFPTAEALGAALMPFASEAATARAFSLRPSRAAIESSSARIVMARRCRRAWQALRTLVATLTLGAALAAVMLVVPRAQARRAVRAPAAQAALSASVPTPFATSVHLASTTPATDLAPPPRPTALDAVARRAATPPAVYWTSRPRPNPNAPAASPSSRKARPHDDLDRPLYL